MGPEGLSQGKWYEMSWEIGYALIHHADLGLLILHKNTFQ